MLRQQATMKTTIPTTASRPKRAPRGVSGNSRIKRFISVCFSKTDAKVHPLSDMEIAVGTKFLQTDCKFIARGPQDYCSGVQTALQIVQNRQEVPPQKTVKTLILWRVYQNIRRRLLGEPSFGAVVGVIRGKSRGECGRLLGLVRVLGEVFLIVPQTESVDIAGERA